MVLIREEPRETANRPHDSPFNLTNDNPRYQSSTPEGTIQQLSNDYDSCWIVTSIIALLRMNLLLAPPVSINLAFGCMMLT